MDTLLDVFTAFGVGAAAGLSPFVAIAAVVLLSALHVGVNPDGSDFSFVNDVVAVVVASLVLVQAFLADLSGGGLRFRIAADHRLHRLAHWIVSAVLAGLAGSVVFVANDHDPVIGTIVGVLGAVLVAYGGSGFFGRVGERVKRSRDAKQQKNAEQGKEKGSGDAGAIALAVDLIAIAAVLASLVAPPLGLIVPLFVIVAMIGSRRKQQQKYEGLRTLR